MKRRNAAIVALATFAVVSGLLLLVPARTRLQTIPQPQELVPNEPPPSETELPNQPQELFPVPEYPLGTLIVVAVLGAALGLRFLNRDKS